MDLTLVILAAGMGSRFGGIKQMESVGPNGELLIEYSVYDAIKAGFNKIVFVIKDEIKDVFYEKMYNKVKDKVNAVCVYQSLDDMPEGFKCPENRVKPWGTAHAVYTAREVIDSPFGVINADDFYGYSAYEILVSFFKSLPPGSKHKYCNVGYRLKNTISEMGSVSRGQCISENGKLTAIYERKQIINTPDGIKYTEDDKNYHLLPENTIVSMNCFGYTKDFIIEIKNHLPEFFINNMHELKSELYLPEFTSRLINNKTAEVDLLECNEKWYGFTYKGELETVQNAISQMIKEGKYPLNLWK